jgi:uncharacterized membrane protein YfcA
MALLEILGDEVNMCKKIPIDWKWLLLGFVAGLTAARYSRIYNLQLTEKLLTYIFIFFALFILYYLYKKLKKLIVS